MAARKLSDAESREIRLLCRIGYTQASVARAYGVSESAVSLIVNWKSHCGRQEDGNVVRGVEERDVR